MQIALIVAWGRWRREWKFLSIYTVPGVGVGTRGCKCDSL